MLHQRHVGTEQHDAVALDREALVTCHPPHRREVRHLPRPAGEALPASTVRHEPDGALRQPDALLADKYTAHEAFGQPSFSTDGYIEITNPMTQPEGRIKFQQPVWEDFAVIFLDPDYRFTVVGRENRSVIWLFAREPRLSDEVYHAMLDVARKNGFDVAKILRFPHRREELGAPGFQ